MTGGGVAVLTAPVKKASSAIAATGGGVIAYTGVKAFPEVHTGTATLTGGGVITRVGIKKAVRSETSTGGGVLAITGPQKKATRVQPMTGGGVAVLTRTHARASVQAMTGGGVATLARTSLRRSVQSLAIESVDAANNAFVVDGDPLHYGYGIVVQSIGTIEVRGHASLNGTYTSVTAEYSDALDNTYFWVSPDLPVAAGGGFIDIRRVPIFTGGGVATYAYSKVEAEARTGTAVLTGGGVITRTGVKQAVRTQAMTGGGVAAVVRIAARGPGAITATGGGVATVARTQARTRSETMTGGGRITYAYAAGSNRSGFLTATGGGVVVLVRMKKAVRTETMTGGGVAVLTPTKKAIRSQVLTGGGVIAYTATVAVTAANRARSYVIVV